MKCVHILRGNRQVNKNIQCTYADNAIHDLQIKHTFISMCECKVMFSVGISFSGERTDISVKIQFWKQRRSRNYFILKSGEPDILLFFRLVRHSWSRWLHSSSSSLVGRCLSLVYNKLLQSNNNNSSWVNSRILTQFIDLRCLFHSWKRVCR